MVELSALTRRTKDRNLPSQPSLRRLQPIFFSILNLMRLVFAIVTQLARVWLL